MRDMTNGKNYFYHYDGLGSVIALSDANGVLVERYEYDVFGKPTIRDASGTVISQSGVGNPFMFTGRRYDDESGLYYYRARYYKPGIGRFMQADPIRYVDSMNLYGYVKNNPINGIDPYGLITRSECLKRYNDQRKKTLDDMKDCMKDCGYTPVGLGTPLCAMSCAKTGPYFATCFVGCTSTMAAVNVTCHILCTKIAGTENDSSKRALKRCLKNACD